MNANVYNYCNKQRTLPATSSNIVTASMTSRQFNYLSLRHQNRLSIGLANRGALIPTPRFSLCPLFATPDNNFHSHEQKASKKTNKPLASSQSSSSPTKEEGQNTRSQSANRKKLNGSKANDSNNSISKSSNSKNSSNKNPESENDVNEPPSWSSGTKRFWKSWSSLLLRLAFLIGSAALIYFTRGFRAQKEIRNCREVLYSDFVRVLDGGYVSAVRFQRGGSPSLSKSPAAAAMSMGSGSRLFFSIRDDIPSVTAVASEALGGNGDRQLTQRKTHSSFPSLPFISSSSSSTSSTRASSASPTTTPFDQWRDSTSRQVGEWIQNLPVRLPAAPPFLSSEALKSLASHLPFLSASRRNDPSAPVAGSGFLPESILPVLPANGRSGFKKQYFVRLSTVDGCEPYILDRIISAPYPVEFGVIQANAAESLGIAAMAAVVSWLPLLPLLAFGGRMAAEAMRGGGPGGMGGGGGPPGGAGAPAKKSSISIENVDIRFSDVAGLEAAKRELREVVAMMQMYRSPRSLRTNPTAAAAAVRAWEGLSAATQSPGGAAARYARLGAKAPSGVVLSGPPGTGKTLLAKAVAGEAGLPFLSVSASEFVELYVGRGAARVRELFGEARRVAPCVVFIDELDAVGGRRGAGHNDERDQTLNQLLTELDGFDGRKGVFFLAATNRLDALDPALLRPGRISRKVMVPLPDSAGRAAVLQCHLKGVPLAAALAAAAGVMGGAAAAGANISNGSIGYSNSNSNNTNNNSSRNNYNPALSSSLVPAPVMSNPNNRPTPSLKSLPLSASSPNPSASLLNSMEEVEVREKLAVEAAAVATAATERICSAISAVTEGFSGAELAEVVNEATLIAARRDGEDAVTMDDLLEGVRRTKYGVNGISGSSARGGIWGNVATRLAKVVAERLALGGAQDNWNVKTAAGEGAGR